MAFNLGELGEGVLEFGQSTIDRMTSQNENFSLAEAARAKAMLANVQIVEERERRAQDRKDKNQELIQNVLYILAGLAGFGLVAYVIIYIRKSIM